MTTAQLAASLDIDDYDHESYEHNAEGKPYKVDCSVDDDDHSDGRRRRDAEDGNENSDRRTSL